MKHNSCFIPCYIMKCILVTHVCITFMLYYSVVLFTQINSENSEKITYGKLFMAVKMISMFSILYTYKKENIFSK